MVDRQHTLGPLLDHAQARVGGDPIEPGAKRTSTLEAGESAPGAGAASPAARPRRRPRSRAAGSSARAKLGLIRPTRPANASSSPAVQREQPALVAHRFGSQRRDLARFRTRDDAAPARRPFPRLEQHDRSELTHALGRRVDPVDLDVGQPERPTRSAFDDTAAEMRARVERQVGTRRGSDDLRTPVQELGVEGARPHLIGRVELETAVEAIAGSGSYQSLRRNRYSLPYSSCRRIQSCQSAPSSRPLGAWSRIRW